MITTHGVKYIGSKKKLNDSIVSIIKKYAPDASTAIDVFTGTTRVAQALKQNGFTVTTSDLSWASTHYSNTWIGNKDNTHLQQHINFLNNLGGYNGWLTQHYTGEEPEYVLRSTGRLFKSKNTRKADAIRDTIDTFELEAWEKSTLITSLIKALDAVDNTVGIQQAYLKEWCSRADEDLFLKLPEMIPGEQGKHLEGNCLDLDYGKHDLAYLDPPYSGHSYSAYYHVWDSIARWDKPEVDTNLKNNRRADRSKKNEAYDPSMESPWYNSKTALTAFEEILRKIPARYLIISYSDESIVDGEELFALCRSLGLTIVTEVDYKRNIMSTIGNAAKTDGDKKVRNVEYIIFVDKETEHCDTLANAKSATHFNSLFQEG